jgi:hypothetical protein
LGCERRASLACLKASRPDQRHPVKVGAFRAPRIAACGLDRLSPAQQGLAMQVRLDRKQNVSSSCEEFGGRGIALPASAGSLETFLGEFGI